jgi:hypothetical protein
MEKTEKRVLKRPPELIRLCNLIELIDQVWCETEDWPRERPEAQIPSELVTRAACHLDEVRGELLDVARRIAGEDDLDPASVSFWAAAREAGMSPPLEGATA